VATAVTDGAAVLVCRGPAGPGNAGLVTDADAFVAKPTRRAGAAGELAPQAIADCTTVLPAGGLARGDLAAVVADAAAAHAAHARLPGRAAAAVELAVAVVVDDSAVSVATERAAREGIAVPAVDDDRGATTVEEKHHRGRAGDIAFPIGIDDSGSDRAWAPAGCGEQRDQQRRRRGRYGGMTA